MGVLFPFWWLVGCAAICLIGWRRLGGIRSPWRLFALAFVVRIVPAVVASMPSEAFMRFDIESMRMVGDFLRGGADVYANTDRYPYLPLQMYWFAAAAGVSDATGIPFEALLKLPLVVADALVCVLVWYGSRAAESAVQRSESPSAKASALNVPAEATGIGSAAIAIRAGAPGNAALIYAFNPVSIAIACIHGQFDAMAILPLLAAMLVVRQGSSPCLAGILFGLGLLSKPWPSILLPIALAHTSGWRRRFVFLVGLGAVCLTATAIYWMLFAESLFPMLRRVAGYSSMVGGWGIPLVSSLITGSGLGTIAAAYHVEREVVLRLGKLLLVGVVVGVGFGLRRLPIEKVFCSVILAFYVCTYGWGFHYLTWIVPFLLLSSTSCVARLFLASASVSLFLVMYGMLGIQPILPGWPILFAHPSAVSLLMWCACVIASIALLVEWRLRVSSFESVAELQGPSQS